MLLIPNLIHSQDTLSTNNFKKWDSTSTEMMEISPFRLNELAKFVDFKYKIADPSLEYRSRQIVFLDSLLNKKILEIDQLENHSIPALEGRIRAKDSLIIERTSERGLIEANYENKLRKQVGKKWTWATLALLIGTAFGFVIGL